MIQHSDGGLAQTDLPLFESFSSCDKHMIIVQSINLRRA